MRIAMSVSREALGNFRLFREGKIAIPVRDCSKVEDEDLDNMLAEVLRVNFDEDTGI